MKPLTTIILVLLTFCAVHLNAQSRKSALPALFSDHPSSIELTSAQLSNLFLTAEGENVSLVFPGGFQLAGRLTSKLVKYTNLETIVIRLTAFSNTLCSISKQTEKGLVTYVGRIFNPAITDGYELKKLKGDNYQLVKVNTENTLPYCNQASVASR